MATTTGGVTTATTFERRTLPNGARLLTAPMANVQSTSCFLMFAAGSRYETADSNGIAHFAEHMFFKGTPTRGVGEIAKETKASGGYLNASTIYDHTVYYTVLPSSGLRSGLGSCHSRLRLVPAALVRRWPRREPSGFMFGTMWKVALPSSRRATGSASSSRRSRAPSIHHSAIVSPGCWRA